MKSFGWKWIGAAGLIVAIVTSLLSYNALAGPNRPEPRPQRPQYIVLGWNNLGMHCYDPDFSNIGILPPYNTLVAQVIKVGDPPQIVTSGVIVEYVFPDNTYSVKGPGVLPGGPDKTNFWKYAKDLFGVSLKPNIGLTGKGLSGRMDPASDGKYFIAEGIPLTDLRDQDAVNQKPYPFQKAVITVKDARNPASVLAQLTVVAPVSTELSCMNCHADTMDATTRYPITPTGKVEKNILAIHDYLNSGNYTREVLGDLVAKTPLMSNQPVLCAWCHSSNALGTKGVPGVMSLSNAIHQHHKQSNAPDITFDTDGCYNCHPGQKTQCLRDTMSQHFALNCADCHNPAGNDKIEPMLAVGQNPSPWLNEPQCSDARCHGVAYAANQPKDMPLYRESTGHGGVYCCGCHDSPHAVAPSRENNDSIKFIELQGHAGTLRDCTTCHLTAPTRMFKHAQ